MINWINFNIDGDLSIMDELQLRLGQILSANETLTLRLTDESAMLFVESFQAEAIVDELETVSKRNPDEQIGIRYAASVPGSYHVITGLVKRGKMQILKDKTEKILE